MNRLSLLLAVVGLVASAADAPAAPQRQDDTPLRSRWDQLTPEEREHVKQNFDHWKQLSPDERELMKRRHERLELERKRVDAALPDDDHAALEKRDEHERRREITRRAKEALHERFEQLPPELRERIKTELAKLPPAQREKRVREFVKQQVQRLVKEKLGRLVKSGRLTHEDVEQLHEQVKDAPPLERLDVLRRFVVEHAQSLGIAPDVLERVKSESDAGFGLDLLDRWLREKQRGGFLHLPRRHRELGLPPPRDREPPPPGSGAPPHKRGI